MSITHPWLADSWDAHANGPLLDWITSGSAEVVSWCCVRGHRWTASVKARATGALPCPQCPAVRNRRAGTPSAARLAPDQVRAIRADPRPSREIAHTYQVTTSAINRIKSGRAWQDLP
ncbi:zinc-ribbon domain-containing protein [Longispora sp. K20-0274]|uniref:zinc-ribbon domain-containing protein n=1 Tax=Longispora sp. K20-0274 TaxID=3088255 RepID=UPI0039998EDF